MDTTTNQNSPLEPRLLRRSVDRRMIAGVAAGLSEYFDIDPTLVRIGLVALDVPRRCGRPALPGGLAPHPRGGFGGRRSPTSPEPAPVPLTVTGRRRRPGRRKEGHAITMGHAWGLAAESRRGRQLRVSDAERNEVAELLSKHYGDGRLDAAEFQERLDRAMSAKTRADLSGLLADLPRTARDAGPLQAAAPVPPVSRLSHPRSSSVVAVRARRSTAPGLALVLPRAVAADRGDRVLRLAARPVRRRRRRYRRRVLDERPW